MAGVQPWFATQGAITIGSVVTTVTTTSTLGSLISGTAFTTYCKNVSISGGGKDLGAGNLFGLNQFQEVGRPDVVTCTLTMVGKNKDIFESVFTTASTVTGSYQRINFGETTTQKAVLLAFTDGTNHAHWALNNAVISVDNVVECAADGNTEVSVTLKALTQDVYFEDDFG